MHAVEDALEQGAALEARQVGTQAKVLAVAEGHVLLVLAIDVEDVRVLEDCLIPIGARVVHQQLVPLANLLATQLRVPERRASHVDRRRLDAQHLLDGGRNQRGVRAQALHHFGMLEQQQMLII